MNEELPLRRWKRASSFTVMLILAWWHSIYFHDLFPARGVSKFTSSEIWVGTKTTSIAIYMSIRCLFEMFVLLIRVFHFKEIMSKQINCNMLKITMMNFFISHRSTFTIPVYSKAHLNQFLPIKFCLLQSSSVFVSFLRVMKIEPTEKAKGCIEPTESPVSVIRKSTSVTLRNLGSVKFIQS